MSQEGRRPCWACHDWGAAEHDWRTCGECLAHRDDFYFSECNRCGKRSFWRNPQALLQTTGEIIYWLILSGALVVLLFWVVERWKK